MSTLDAIATIEGALAALRKDLGWEDPPAAKEAEVPFFGSSEFAGTPQPPRTSLSPGFWNASPRKFQSITNEARRTYVFERGGELWEMGIDNPEWLSVSDSGHYVYAEGEMNFVPFGWICLVWESHPGAPTIEF